MRLLDTGDAPRLGPEYTSERRFWRGGKTVPALVLASTSPIRAKILRDAGFTVEIVAPEVSEDPGQTVDPAALAEELALRKARAVAARRPDAWVIGADQVAHDPDVPGVSWGKPKDEDDHLARLGAMRGRRHELCAGWALIGPDGPAQSGVERVSLWGRADLEDRELAAYVRGGEGRWCAGGYAIEGQGAFLFDRIAGDWTTILGLPLFAVIGALRARGWRAA
jgi:septum formation protein